MFVRSWRVVLCLALLIPSLGRAQQVTRRYEGIELTAPWMGRHVLLDSLAVWHEVAAPAPQTYAAIVRLADSLKLPVERADSARGVVFNRRFVARRLAGRAMSRWIRCGSGLAGDYADIWRATIAYAVFAEPGNTGGTRVGVALFATVTDVEGTSQRPTLCATTGALEAEIVKRVRAAVSP